MMTEEEKKPFRASGSGSIPTSPIVKEKRDLLKLDLERNHYNDELSSCCSKKKTDAQLLKIILKYTISCGILAFACIQLAHIDECSNLSSFYTSVITMILTTWVRDNQSGGVKKK